MKSKGSSLIEEASQFMQDVEPEPDHVVHVSMLSEMIFDHMAPIHRLGRGHQELLISGALLHDIGWSISPSGKSHHKYSSQLILEKKWKHANKHQIRMISLIARYHRKSLPSPDHKEYMLLGSKDRETLRKLASILRIADAFDRSHLQRVKAVSTEITEDEINFTLISDNSCSSEIAAFHKKNDLFLIEYPINQSVNIHVKP